MYTPGTVVYTTNADGTLTQQPLSGARSGGVAYVYQQPQAAQTASYVTSDGSTYDPSRGGYVTASQDGSQLSAGYGAAAAQAAQGQQAAYTYSYGQVR